MEENERVVRRTGRIKGKGGGGRVCGVAVLLDFKYGFADIFISPLKLRYSVFTKPSGLRYLEIVWKISMRFAVFLCYSVRCLYVIMCGFAIFLPPLRTPRIREGGTDGDKKEEKKAPDHAH